MNKTVILTLTAAALLSTTDAVAQLKYPATAKDNTVDEYFGEKVADPYRWLENDTSAATAEWVREENLVSRKYLDNIPMRKAILKRLKETANYEKRGMAFERGGKWYAYRNDGLQNQSVLYQMDRYDAPVSEWRVWLDPNTLSTDGTVALKSTTFSHDGKYMAYVISRNGSDWEEIYVKDVATGKTLDESRAEGARAPDPLTAVLLGAGVALLSLGIIGGEGGAWTAPATLAALLGGVAVLALFAWRNRRVRDPLVAPELFRIRAFSAAALGYLVFSGGFYALLLSNVLFMTGAWGYPTLLAHYRDGQRLRAFAPGEISMSRANDQHGYLPTAGLDLRVGDVLKFGISHPCTAFDKWRFIPVVDDDYTVIDGVLTIF